ncbi:DUF6722 family protein [uncultured Bacteroides sp.]|uniref:DUF6722 family protein n=1 Tax=uncultured Bacteroides sp. TaxID=162156 RepID=UPI002597A246|nr:DUF6722 family protein [uncultured Bacteroides sp.]
MSKLDEVFKPRERLRKRNETRREKLAGYFFDLSKLTFAGLVIGGITPLFKDDADGIGWVTTLLGIVSTYIFAFFANRIIK